ncbi:MAG: hypothetical protein ACQETK_04255 [Pseudomonadota bacterium]
MATANTAASMGEANGGAHKGMRTTLIHAAVAGGCALAMLLLAFWVWMATGDRTLDVPGASLVIPASDLQLAEGRGEVDGHALQLHGVGARGRAILVTGVPDGAPDLARLTELHIPAVGPDGIPDAVLMWVNAADPGTEHAERIDLEAGLDLAEVSGWDGQPAMLGLLLQGPGVAGLQIRGLEFRGDAPGPLSALRAILRAWIEPVAFSNVTPGVVRAGPTDVPIRPTTVAIVWVLLALVVFVLVHRLRGAHGVSVGVVLLVLMAWFALDLRWQADLVHEHRNTFASHAGDPGQARVPADYGGQDLLALVTAAKEQLEPDARVFTISGNDGLTRYVRYRLLPLPGFFQERLTRDVLRHARPGDALILLVPHEVSLRRLRRGLSATARTRFPWQADAQAWQGAATAVTDTDDGPMLEFRGEGRGQAWVEVPFSLSSAFYRLVVRLDTPEPEGTLRLEVRRTATGDDDDQTELVSERAIPARELAAGAREFSLGFGLPARGNIMVQVSGLSPGARLGALRIEHPEDAADWVAVARNGRPPLRAARLLRQDEGDLLLELQ